MKPRYSNGDIVVYKTDPTKNQYIVCKFILKGKKRSYLLRDTIDMTSVHQCCFPIKLSLVKRANKWSSLIDPNREL